MLHEPKNYAEAWDWLQESYAENMNLRKRIVELEGTAQKQANVIAAVKGWGEKYGTYFYIDYPHATNEFDAILSTAECKDKELTNLRYVGGRCKECYEKNPPLIMEQKLELYKDKLRKMHRRAQRAESNKSKEKKELIEKIKDARLWRDIYHKKYVVYSRDVTKSNAKNWKLALKISRLLKICRRLRKRVDVNTNPLSEKPTIDQVAWVLSHLYDHHVEGGSYRVLVYKRMGFDTKAYAPLMNAGGLSLSNAFNELLDYRKEDEK